MMNRHLGRTSSKLSEVFEAAVTDGLHPEALRADLPRFKKGASGSHSGEPPPSALELYHKTSQDLQRSWKVEASFGNILFHLVKHGWLKQHVEDEMDMKHTLSGMDPEWAAVIEYVPMLVGIYFFGAAAARSRLCHSQGD